MTCSDCTEVQGLVSRDWARTRAGAAKELSTAVLLILITAHAYRYRDNKEESGTRCYDGLDAPPAVAAGWRIPRHPSVLRDSPDDSSVVLGLARVMRGNEINLFGLPRFEVISA
mgnify:FL=1